MKKIIFGVLLGCLVAPAAEASEPPGGPNSLYTIRQGDTLWEISRRFLGSPWYWPKLWSKNPQIENPHWIFPGQRLYVGSRGIPSQPTKNITDTSPFTFTKSTIKKLRKRWELCPPPCLQGTLATFRRRESFIDKAPTANKGNIIAAANGQQLLTKGDRVYLRLKQRRSLQVGTRLSIYKHMKQVKDPKTKQVAGYQIRLLGVVQIKSFAKRHTVGQIVEAFQEIDKGHLVGPYIHPKVRITPKRNAALIGGRILRAATESTLAAQYVQIYLNRGKDHGLRAGNRVGLFKNKSLQAGGTSKTRIGTAILLDVRQSTSVALVTQSQQEIHAGDTFQTTLQP